MERVYSYMLPILPQAFKKAMSYLQHMWEYEWKRKKFLLLFSQSLDPVPTFFSISFHFSTLF